MRRHLAVPTVVLLGLLGACSGGAPDEPAPRSPTASTTASATPAGELQSFELPEAGTPRRYDV